MFDYFYTLYEWENTWEVHNWNESSSCASCSFTDFYLWVYVQSTTYIQLSTINRLRILYLVIRKTICVQHVIDNVIFIFKWHLFSLCIHSTKRNVQNNNIYETLIISKSLFYLLYIFSRHDFFRRCHWSLKEIIHKT